MQTTMSAFRTTGINLHK